MNTRYEGMSIGWFGVPGASSSQSTLTHLVKDGKPACGAKLREGSEYQWCITNIERESCECLHCARKIRKLRERIRQ